MNSPLAVVGMACRYPGASSLMEFWDNVLARRVQFRDIPSCRLSGEYISSDPDAPDRTYGRRAAVLDGFSFDAVARRVPKRTAEGADIVHWLALEVALAAADDAKLCLDSLEARQQIGVVLGNTLTGEETRANALRTRWPFVRQALHIAAGQEGLDRQALMMLERRMEGIYKSVFPPVTEDTLAGGLSNTIAGRICNYLDLGGGAFTIDGACSSSLLAVTVAGDMLVNRRADIMLVGGVDVSIDPFELVGFAKATALSKDEMRVYDQRGNGFIPGEGCGFVVLKRLEDAERDRDRIYAIVDGWGISTDGRGALTSPAIAGQSLALRRAYEMAGYSPAEVRFIEGHGTGTKVGDRVELCAISEAVSHFSPKVAASQIGVTSLKSIVGHTKAAAGIGGFIKTVMAASHRMIPPMAGCDRPHEVFGKEAACLYPVRTARRVARDASIHAGVSAMGFGGINCHVAISSGPVAVSAEERARDEQVLASWQGWEVFPLAAGSRLELRVQAEELLAQARGISVADLADLAVHRASGPPDGPMRAAIVASSPDELTAKLRELIASVDKAPADLPGAKLGKHLWFGAPSSAPSIAFLFSGQGSQRAELGLEMFLRFPWARSLFELADESLAAYAPQLGQPLSRVVLEAGADPRLARELDHTELAQPAICLVSMLWCRYLERIGLKASRVAGHSLGELTALWAAGAYDDATLLRLAACRGGAMAAHPARPSGMLALSCGPELADSLVREAPGYCVVANYNSPKQQVVAGEKEALTALAELARARGIHTRELHVSNAFHSKLVETARDVLKGADFLPGEATLELPFHSGCQAGAVCERLDVAGYLADQVVKPVHFAETLEGLAAKSDWLVEVGPGQILSGLAYQTGLHCTPVATDGSRSSLCALVAEAFCRGVDVAWSALYENRAVRPFVPADERQFYRNPCEKLVGPAPLARDYPEIILADTALETQVGERAVPGVVAPEGADSVLERVRHIISEQTGFPPESIAPHVLLLDNLNLDSLKAMALLDEVGRSFGIRGKLAPQHLANASVEQLAAAVSGALEAMSGGRPGGEREEEAWVESFEMELVTAPVPAPVTAPVTAPVPTSATPGSQDGGDSIALFADPGDEALARALRHALPRAEMVDLTAIPSPRARATVLVLVPKPAGSRVRSWQSATAFLARFGGYWKQLGENGRAACTRVIFAQFSDGHLGRLETAENTSIQVSSFASSFLLDNPDLKVQVVDLHARAAEGVVVEQIACEVRACPAAPLTIGCYGEDGARREPRLRRVATPAERANPLWKRNDVVLVTGGGKGITAECALAFAQASGVKLAVLGRSAAPASRDEQSELADTLRRYADEGITASYFQCDVADSHALAATVLEVEAALGPVTGVIHGAGMNKARRIEDVSSEEAWEEMAPKLQGVANLGAIFGDRPLKLFCALTSVIGVSGMVKNAWYAFANEQVDAFLRHYRFTHPDTQVIGLAYSAWDEVGMGVKMGSISLLSHIGMTPIPVDQGVAQFVAWTLHRTANAQVVISSRMGDLPTWRYLRPAPATSTHRFVDEVTRLEPEVEAAIRCTLTTERFAFLRDHDFHGSILLPTVMGLEAMAEVVQLVSGRAELLPVHITNLELERPVLIPPRGNTIEIVATRLVSRAGEEVYGLRLYSEETDFGAPHFHCEFRFGPVRVPTARRPATGTPLPLQPVRDLYGRLLFQGHSFQRLESVFALDDRACTFGTKSDQDAGSSYLLGDPYSRDALLQAMQLVVTPEEALPVRVRSWRILKRLGEGARAVAHGDLLTREHDVRGGDLNAWSASDGSVLEQLGDYEAKVLHIRRDWPTPAELTVAMPAELTAAMPAELTTPTPAELTTPTAAELTAAMPAELTTPTPAELTAAMPAALTTPTPPAESGSADLEPMRALYRRLPAARPTHDGPDGQWRLRLADFATFRDASSLSRHANHAYFIDWMGRLREVATFPIRKQWTSDLMSGAWGLVTNSSGLTYERPVSAGDLIEGSFYLRSQGGTQGSTLHFGFEWHRLEDEQQVLVARGWMDVTWVAILGPGRVEPRPFPDYFNEFFRTMVPTADRAPTLAALREEGRRGGRSITTLGQLLGSAPRESLTGTLIYRHAVQTGQTHSNLVGNVYYANYSSWQVAAVDALLEARIPGLFRAYDPAAGELRCAHASIQHLREAMPFDRIAIDVHLRELGAQGMKLEFIFRRLDEQGSTRLAVGQATALWSVATSSGEWRTATLPAELQAGLLAELAAKSPSGAGSAGLVGAGEREA